MPVRSQPGVEASHVYVSPRRIAFVVDELPETASEQLVRAPAERREQAAAGFAKRYGLAEADLEERDGHLWARVPGELRGSRCSTVYADRPRIPVLEVDALGREWASLRAGRALVLREARRRDAGGLRQVIRPPLHARRGRDRLRRRSTPTRCEPRTSSLTLPSAAASSKSYPRSTGRTCSASSRKWCTWSSGRSSSSRSSTSGSCACPSA